MKNMNLSGIDLRNVETNQQPSSFNLKIAMELKYKKGEIVFDRARPTQKLIVSSYKNGIYYCKAHEHQRGKELVYFERDLMPVTPNNGWFVK